MCHPVLPWLECDRSEDETLPTEAMIATEFNYIIYGVEADWALLWILLRLLKFQWSIT